MAPLRNKTNKPRPSNKPTSSAPAFPDGDQALLGDIILACLTGLKSGSIEITVHEGRITYIEKRERQRANLICPEDDGGHRAPDVARKLN